MPNEQQTQADAILAHAARERAITEMLKLATNYKCECGSEKFLNYLELKQISALTSGTGKDEIMLVSSLACAKCQKEYRPAQATPPPA